MSDLAVIKATFSEWRMVKGRKVLQLVMEVPLEQQQAVADALGFPMPDTETWVAVARLREGIPEQRRRGKYAQQAGILCAEVAFQKFMETATPEACAEALRQHCGVLSRAHLDDNDVAARRFLDLKADYELWLRDAA